MIAFLAPLFTALFAKIVAFATWFTVLATILFACIWLLSTDFAKWAFEQLLDLIIFILKDVSIDFKFLDPTSYVTLPSELSNIMELSGAGVGLGIILSAIIVKITLQLIPFTRLGS